MNPILNDLVLLFAIADQSCRQPHASLRLKQRELGGLAVAVVILEPEDMRSGFDALFDHPFDAVVIALANLVWNRDFALHALKIDCVDEFARRRIKERYVCLAGIVTAPREIGTS